MPALRSRNREHEQTCQGAKVMKGGLCNEENRVLQLSKHDSYRLRALQGERAPRAGCTSSKMDLEKPVTWFTVTTAVPLAAIRRRVAAREESITVWCLHSIGHIRKGNATLSTSSSRTCTIGDGHEHDAVEWSFPKGKCESCHSRATVLHA
jgi:hypothetical protein